MSTVETGQRDWSTISDQNINSKYEKCRNITEEIYKRINITFQIKKLEAGQSDVSDNSDQIDSNELSNETDLFACDKSDITSSTEAEKPPTDCGKFININNNNEEKNKPVSIAVTKRPKKKFRKRVKKRPVRAVSDSEGSSDEAPLSRIADAPTIMTDIPTNNAALKPKSDKKPTKKDTKKPNSKTPQKKPVETTDKRNQEPKTLSVRIDKLPDIFSMTDTSGKNYRSFMKDNKLTIRNEPKIEENDLSYTKPSPKTDKLSVKADKLSLKTDKLSMKEESVERKNCSLCSLTFRGERGLRRHMSMSHLISAEDCK